MHKYYIMCFIGGQLSVLKWKNEMFYLRLPILDFRFKNGKINVV